MVLNLPDVLLDLFYLLGEHLHLLLAEEAVALEFVLDVGDLLFEGVAAVVFFAINFVLYFLPAFVEEFDFGGRRADIAGVHCYLNLICHD